MSKKVLVVLIGDADGRPVDLYQEAQGQHATSEGRAAGVDVEVAWATSFDQYGAVRRRLASSPVDAVVAAHRGAHRQVLLGTRLGGLTPEHAGPQQAGRGGPGARARQAPQRPATHRPRRTAAAHANPAPKNSASAWAQACGCSSATK